MEQDRDVVDNMQNVGSVNTEPLAPEGASLGQIKATQVGPASNAVDKKKDSKGLLLGLILCLILAIGGIGFGIWAMMDGNSRVEKLNAEIKILNSQNADLLEQIDSLNEELDGMGSGESWAETEVESGVFYVKDAEGNIIAQSEGVEVKEIIECSSSADDTVLKCVVSTSEGEGSFLYDVYSDSDVLEFVATSGED